MREGVWGKTPGHSFFSVQLFQGSTTFAGNKCTLAVPLTLAIEMVCCSITSWMAVRSPSSILSNSSMQQMPWSASTRAPPSSVISPVTGSFITAAVRPTPELPRPVVYWPGVEEENFY